MDIYSFTLYFSIIAGFLMAFSLGANDVANSMASAVGARAITIKQAVFIAGSLNFLGAVFFGSHVAATISKGIIRPEAIPEPALLMVGMLAALLSAGLWVLMATLTALPVSSTHSIVGSILGFGLLVGGMNAVNWWVMGGIVLSWIVSPFFGSLISYLVFTQIRRQILYKKHFLLQARKWTPFWITLTAALIIFSFVYKTPAGKNLHMGFASTLLLVLALCGVVWFISRLMIGRMMRGIEESAEGVESVFRTLQVGTSCYVAVSQGANDVANAIGPVATIYLIAREHALPPTAEVPMFLLVLGGLGITAGITMLGYKVMATVGEKITALNNTRGFAVDFGAATTVLVASNLGMPVSTTHAAVGSVVGVGLARGFSAVDFRVLGKIVLYWVLTVPIAALTCILIFQILRFFML